MVVLPEETTVLFFPHALHLNDAFHMVNINCVRNCPVHEVMAITGHQSVEEVERYTREYSRPMVADRAMGMLISAATSAASTVPLSEVSERSGTLEDEWLSDFRVLPKGLADTAAHAWRPHPTALATS